MSEAVEQKKRVQSFFVWHHWNDGPMVRVDVAGAGGQGSDHWQSEIPWAESSTVRAGFIRVSLMLVMGRKTGGGLLQAGPGSAIAAREA